MGIEFGSEDQYPALDLYWTDEISEEDDIADVAGGELRIIEATADNEVGQTVFENAAAIIGEIHDILVEILARESELSHATLHFCSLHALRDFKSAMFLAMAGRYRQATILHRSALEVTAHGAYFEIEGDDGAFEAWVEGKAGNAPNTSDLKSALSKLDYPEADDLADHYGRRHGDLSTMSHSFIGGDIERVVDGEDERPPLHGWSAYFDLDDLLEWYADFVNDCYFVYYLLGYFWDFEEVEAARGITFQIFDDVSEGWVRSADGDVEVELP